MPAASSSRSGRLRYERLLVALRIWLVRLAFYFGRLLPVRQRVVLATAHLDHIQGNLAAIRDEVDRREPPIGLTVLAYRAQPNLIGLLRGALNALVAGYHLARARIFVVDDYFFPIYVVRPRRGTTIVQVWHACGAFKRFGLSIGDRSFGASATLTRMVRIHSNYDVCLASSEETAGCYAEAFGQPLDRFVWTLGIPRTDILLRQPQASETRQRVRQQYGLPEGRRVVLYAPTFRGDRTYDAAHPAGLDLDLLRRALGGDHTLLLRQHPFVRSRQPLDELSDFVVDVSDHPDVNELMLASDVLVTDYSSVIFEFALLGRPIVLFAPDHAAYERERGFYFDYRTEGPGPVFETSAELARYIRASDFDAARVEAFSRRWFTVADGRAAERFVDRLVVPALDGRWAGPDSLR